MQAVAAPVHLASAIAGNHHGHGQEVSHRQQPDRASECQRGACPHPSTVSPKHDPPGPPRSRATARRWQTARRTRVRRPTAVPPAAPRPADIALPSAANAAGSSARIVRAQRSSWRNSAAWLSSGTVVSVTVSASATRRPRPRPAAPARCRPPDDRPAPRKPPLRTRSRRRRHIVAPRQSCRPIARASIAPGRKPWVIWIAPFIAGRASGRGQPGVDRGYQPDARFGQRADQAVQVIRPHMDIGVGDHQDIVPRRRQHVDQIANLAVAAVQGGIDHQGDVAGREPGLQTPDNRHRRIAGIPHAEHNLKLRDSPAGRSSPARPPATVHRRAAASAPSPAARHDGGIARLARANRRTSREATKTCNSPMTDTAAARLARTVITNSTHLPTDQRPSGAGWRSGRRHPRRQGSCGSRSAARPRG